MNEAFSSPRLSPKEYWASDDWQSSRLLVNQGTVLGHAYHTIQPIGYDWMEIETWAYQVYGDRGSVWHIREEGGLARWYMNSGKFWFRDQRDVTTFLLRWASQ